MGKKEKKVSDKELLESLETQQEEHRIMVIKLQGAIEILKIRMGEKDEKAD